MTARQLTLDFEPGLTARYPDWHAVLTHAVYASRKGLNGVAADLDVSPTDLTKRLSKDEQRPLRAEQAVGIIESTGDLTPIYWLIERFLRDPETQRTAAIQQLAVVMPMVQALLEQAGVTPTGKGTRR